MKAWQVRDAARDAIWHIRLVATTLQHALRAWGGVAVILRNSPQEVQRERARCMNVISGLCGRLIRLLETLSGREERFDPEATLEELIEFCDIAIADLRVSPLRLIREIAARGDGTPNGADRGRPNHAN
jgi:hypothetical protein